MRKRIKDLAYALKIPKKDLILISEKLDSNQSDFYKNWDEPKTDEKGNPKFDEKGTPLTRPINAPVDSLKKIQKRILENIFYKLSLPEYYYGGVKGKDAVLNSRHHQGNKFFFLTDLKDFYPSLTSIAVENSLRKEGFYPDVSRLLTRISTKGGVIPQGCPTSSFLASLVVHHSIGDLLNKYINEGLKVSVYVDDLTISSPLDFKARTPEIISELRQRGLKINFKKTFYKTKNPLVTGVQVKNNGISPLSHTFERSEESSRSKASRNGHKERIKYIKRISKKSNTSNRD